MALREVHVGLPDAANRVATYMVDYGNISREPLASFKKVGRDKFIYCHRRQSWRVGGRDPPEFGLGVAGGSSGGCGRVSENTIAYFEQKVRFKTSFL